MNQRSAVPQESEQLLVLSVEEAGRRLGIGRSLAYRAVREGEIPSVRIGRRLVVPVAALERMLARLPDDDEFSVDPTFAGGE